MDLKQKHIHNFRSKISDETKASSGRKCNGQNSKECQSDSRSGTQQTTTFKTHLGVNCIDQLKNSNY